jgi:hypothetical protein
MAILVEFSARIGRTSLTQGATRAPLLGLYLGQLGVHQEIYLEHAPLAQCQKSDAPGPCVPRDLWVRDAEPE